MTQRQLAGATGISLGALRDFEQGRTRSLRPRALKELATVLDFDLDSSLPESEKVQIEVLGPLTAWRDRAQISLGSARQRTVLGLLALHWGTSLHRDEIIDTLWGQTPPASAVTEVQSYISRLRKLLVDDSPRHLIATAGRSYELTVNADRLDAARFERLLGSASADENPARACALYERALSLWRGEIVGDLDLLRQHPARTALSCERSQAVLSYANAAGIAGEYGNVLPHLRELCAREPFNEQGHAHLMIALAASGEQAAALRVFGDMRRRLDQELGIHPSPVLAQAHIRVLRQY